MSDIKPLKLQQIDDSEKGYVRTPLKRKSILSFISRHKFWLVLIFLLIVIIIFWKNSSSTSVVQFVINQTPLGEEKGRINVLLLGIAGGTHDGALLTDTIMVASYDPKTDKVNLISLPRDLWLDSEGYKINVLYEKKLKEKKGLEFAEEKIGDLLGIKIPYGVRMDFSGFTKAVDLVGGIDVNVVKSFDDYIYPVEGKEKDTCGLVEKEMDIPEEQAKTLGIEKGMHQVLLREDNSIATASAKVGGKIEFDDTSVFKIFPCRYEHISFEEGLAKMDGETALKFVRSRHGTNGEGSDFARSRRQQQVIAAFKSKVLSTDTLFDMGKITGLLQTFGESVETDIPQSKYPDLLSAVRKIKEIKSFSIDASGKNPLLVTPPVGTYGAWVLIPPNNDFSYIKSLISDFFEDTDTATKSAQPSPTEP